MKKYLGIDLGSKTMGLAISETGVIATGITTLRFKEDDYDEAFHLLVEWIQKENITDVIIGLPKHMNNDIGQRGQISQDFKKRLDETLSLNVVLWDERLSTRLALSTLISGKESRQKQKQKKDELAAVLILQNYLDYKGEQKHG
ncbi:MAG: Holliday junction resolvase RuvX [Acholeplasmataceae bacterium]|nr:Holliday junction resolvase RuvX [Acholeplasmataceae bacterium]